MTLFPYPYASKLLDNQSQDLFWNVRAAVRKANVPDGVTCHHIAFAAAATWPKLNLVSGHFCRAWEHSWLQTPAGHLIDVYPVAQLGGPVLLDGTCGPWPALYVWDHKIQVLCHETVTRDAELTSRLLMELTAALPEPVR